MKEISVIQKKPLILIVEDNRINQMLLMKKFEQQGFHSLQLAKTGQEAIALALKNNPDLILMDIQLPDMNGNEAIQSLRKQKFTGPIVAVSADTAPKDMAASSAAGANGYISKPINFAAFFSQISQYIKLPDGEKNQLQNSLHADRIDPSISAAAKNVFIMDAQEKLQILAAALEHADDENQLGKIKAIAHEYKGNAGYFGLKELEAIARELDMGFGNDQSQESLLALTRQLVATVKGIVDETI
jgi:CheY-like chemotaxis protein